MKKVCLFIIIFALLGFSLSFFWFQMKLTAMKTEISTNAPLPSSVINEKKLERLEQLKRFGQEIKPDEPNFGRANPFAPY